MADTKSQCLQTFKHFVQSAAAKQDLAEADLKVITEKGVHKLLKECVSDDAAKASEAQVFPKYCEKPSKKLTFDTFYGDFLLELAAVLLQNKKKLTKRPDLTDPEVGSLAEEIKGLIAAQHNRKSKTTVVDATTARLTDTSKYTGTHKERFDESGKGKGSGGRVEQTTSSGYVQGYKNEGTYDKKK